MGWAPHYKCKRSQCVACSSPGRQGGWGTARRSVSVCMRCPRIKPSSSSALTVPLCLGLCPCVGCAPELRRARTCADTRHITAAETCIRTRLLLAERRAVAAWRVQVTRADTGEGRPGPCVVWSCKGGGGEERERESPTHYQSRHARTPWQDRAGHSVAHTGAEYSTTSDVCMYGWASVGLAGYLACPAARRPCPALPCPVASHPFSPLHRWRLDTRCGVWPCSSSVLGLALPFPASQWLLADRAPKSQSVSLAPTYQL